LLSDRELAVLRLLAQGLTNRQIAERLVIAPTTVRSHVSSILLKLHVANRTQAVVAAQERGLV
jgi:DNA-binding NarL/FixJ family response regulator